MLVHQSFETPFGAPNWGGNAIGFASAVIADVLPPKKRPASVVRQRDAEHLAEKLFSRLGVEKLKKLAGRSPGSFKPLVEAGILSKEDQDKIALHRFDRFSFGRYVLFSRRYILELDGTIDGKWHGVSVSLNHLGKVVPAHQETDKSTDVAADIKLMWLKSPFARPPEAIEAASRVFHTVKFEGMRREDVLKLVGDPFLPVTSVEKSRHWNAKTKELGFFFDTGRYGWEFYVRFDDKGVCKSVRRQMIP